MFKLWLAFKSDIWCAQLHKVPSVRQKIMRDSVSQTAPEIGCVVEKPETHTVLTPISPGLAIRSWIQDFVIIRTE